MKRGRFFKFLGGFLAFVFAILAGLVFMRPISVYDKVMRQSWSWHGVIAKRSPSFEYFELQIKSLSPKPDNLCILAIHGLGDSAFTWNSLVQRHPNSWGANVRMRILNLPGSGRSPSFSTLEEYQFSKLVIKIKNELLQDCSKWVVVGNSLGGWVSLELARQYPDLILGLILDSPAGVAMEAQESQEIVSVFMSPTAEGLREFQSKAYARPKWIPTFLLEDLVLRLKSMPIEFYLRAQLQDGFLDTKINSMETPVMLIWGEEDKVIPPIMAKKFQKILAKSKLHLIPECGHLAHKECPDDYFEILDSFLSEISVSSSL